MSFISEIPRNDGSTLEVKSNEVFDIPPGHDGWEVSAEHMQAVNCSGVRSWLPDPEAGEILVSSTTRQLADGTELAFEERGQRELKGLSGPRTLFSVLA
jgi:hypothetical protein